MSDQISFDTEKAENLKASLEELDQSLSQEWIMVINQWENLKLTWSDSQFQKFEPRFIRLVETYKQVVKDCEGYCVLLDQQIQSANKRRLTLGNLLQNGFSSAQNTAKRSFIIAEMLVSAVSLVSSAPLPIPNQSDESNHPLTSQLQEQGTINSCPIDSPAKSSIPDLYKQLPKIARTVPLDEQLEEAYKAQEDEKRKKRKREEKNIDTAQGNS